MSDIIHYPNLKTVLMVEAILKKEKDITRTELKKRLPKKVMHQTLNIIITYLEESGKVIDHRHGILWTYRSPEEMERILKNTRPMTEVLRELNEKYNKGAKKTIVREETHPRHNSAGSRRGARTHTSATQKRA